MAASTVDISEGSQVLLRELAEKTGQTTAEVLDKALAAYRRQVFFDKLNAGYGELRENPQAWMEFEAERKEFDATLMDGLDTDERWTDDGRCLPKEPDSNVR